MEKKPTLFKNALMYGVFTAIVLIVIDVVFYLTGLPSTSKIRYISFLFIIGGMMLGTIKYRDKVMGGYISYGKAFLSCFLIALIAGLITAIYSYIFLSFIDPAYLQTTIEQGMEQSRAKLEAKGMSEEQIQSSMDMASGFMKPGMMSLMAFFGTAIWGAILALIVSIFIKKENKSFDAQVNDVQ